MRQSSARTARARRSRTPPPRGSSASRRSRSSCTPRAPAPPPRHNRRGVTTWSGRVEDAPDPEVWRFLRVDDAELLPYDCEATAEHARRLASAGILTPAELDEVENR